jgi:hypothetical protein
MGIARVPNALSIEAAKRFNTCDETPTVLLKPEQPNYLHLRKRHHATALHRRS